MNKIIFILLFSSSLCRGDGSLYLPNLPGYATGTKNAGHNGLDVILQGGAVPNTVNQGTQGVITSPWFVEGTDGTNRASYTVGNSENVNVTNPVTVTNPSVGATGAAVPASGTYNAGNKAGNLTGFLIGQQTMANSLACVLPSDQSAIPVSQSGTWDINNISGTISLPTGAATSANQTNASQKTQIVDGSGSVIASTANALNVNISSGSISGTVTSNQGTSPWVDNISQFGGSNVVTGTGASGAGIPRVTVSNDSTIGLVAGAAIIGKVGIDQTTPGTTNGVQVNAALPAGGNTIGAVTQASGPWTVNQTQISGSAITLGSKTSANSYPVVIASDQGAVTVQDKAPLNSTGSGSAAAATVSTVITLTAPANAVGAFLMNIDTSTANVRWAVNRVATTTLGQQLQPGRDAWIPTSHDISLVAESGTQTYDVQWISQ